MMQQHRQPNESEPLPAATKEEVRERVTIGVTGTVFGFTGANLPGGDNVMLFAMFIVVIASFITRHQSQQQSKPVAERIWYRNTQARTAIATTFAGITSMAVNLLTVFAT